MYKDGLLTSSNDFEWLVDIQLGRRVASQYLVGSSVDYLDYPPTPTAGLNTELSFS